MCLPHPVAYARHLGYPSHVPLLVSISNKSSQFHYLGSVLHKLSSDHDSGVIHVASSTAISSNQPILHCATRMRSKQCFSNSSSLRCQVKKDAEFLTQTTEAVFGDSSLSKNLCLNKPRLHPFLPLKCKNYQYVRQSCLEIEWILLSQNVYI